MAVIPSRLMEHALKAYNYPLSKTTDDFIADFSRLSYIKRLINRFKNEENINVRLLVNHFVLFFNSFKHDVALELITQEVPIDDMDVVYPILYFLDYIPAHALIDEEQLNTSIIEKLKAL